MERIKDRKLVIVNQAVNYLTVGIANAFAEKFENVSLITGNVHEQGEALNTNIKITKINKYVVQGSQKKILSYIIATLKIYWLLFTKFRKHEVFFLSVPPMGYLVKLFVPNRFSVLVWDVYPDSFKILGLSENNPVYKIWSWANKKVFKKTYRLYTIGNKMADLVSQYVDREKILITPIWSIFQANIKPAKEDNPFVAEHSLHNKFVVQYSGNIGLSHNVEYMVELADLMKENKDVKFQIIGRGVRVPYLKELVEERKLENCTILPFQSDDMFPYSLSAADMGVVILDEKTSKGSVPSKTYNLMSYGIPILYLASNDSELHDYSIKYNNGKCFSRQELDKAATFIEELSKDKELLKSLSENSERASHDFKRTNADEIVRLYLEG